MYTYTFEDGRTFEISIDEESRTIRVKPTDGGDMNYVARYNNSKVQGVLISPDEISFEQLGRDWLNDVRIR
jgi:hypothetical protein